MGRAWHSVCPVVMVASMLAMARVSTSEEPDDAPCDLSDVVASKWDEIRAIIDQSRYRESEENEKSLAQVLENFDTKNRRHISVLLTRLVICSRFKNGRHPSSRYVDETVIIDCLVAALSLPDSHSLARNFLFEYARPSQLRARVNRLIRAWDCMMDWRLVFLIGLTDSVEAKHFVDGLLERNEKVPEEIRARLGDIGTEERLVKRFRNESDPVKKGELALKLGYVATPGCVYALACELRNPLRFETHWDIYSVRYKVLQGLGRSLPHHALFNDELLVVVDATSGIGDDATAEKYSGGYIGRVEQWAAKTFRIVWQRPRPPFLLVRSKAVPTPLPE